MELDSPSLCGDFYSSYIDEPLSLFMFSIDSFDSDNHPSSVVGESEMFENEYKNSWRKVLDTGDIWSIK